MDGREVSCIGPGLVCLVGLRRNDGEKDLHWMVNKILNLRLWPRVEEVDGHRKEKTWAMNVKQLSYDVLLVSQFTLYATAKRGNKPDFHEAMPPTDARDTYAGFVEMVRNAYGQGLEHKVKDGAFGEMMQVELVNDGPVTIELSTDELDLSGMVLKTNKFAKSKKPMNAAKALNKPEMNEYKGQTETATSARKVEVQEDGQPQ